MSVGVGQLDSGAQYGFGGKFSGIGTLVTAIQRLAMARSVERIREVVRSAARELAGSDGATFVMRDGEQCFYADEDAIGPLWKGQRFPMSICISGWAMLNRQAVVIRDIYQDDRIPHDAYRPTFVKSLAMMPIRTLDPVGAIGIYWASEHEPGETELALLRALADSTAVAMENVAVYQELEERVRDRTRDLEAVNKALEGFAGRVAHDLRNPLGSIQTAVETLARDGLTDEQRAQVLAVLERQSKTASELVVDLLGLARASGTARRQEIRVSDLVEKLRVECPEVELTVGKVPEVVLADPVSFRQALLNLARNAGAYARTNGKAHVELEADTDGELTVFSLADRGPGLPPELQASIFEPFARGQSDEPGTGLGLAIVGAMAEAHGGRAWYEDRPGGGAVFKIAIAERA